MAISCTLYIYTVPVSVTASVAINISWFFFNVGEPLPFLTEHLADLGLIGAGMPQVPVAWGWVHRGEVVRTGAGCAVVGEMAGRLPVDVDNGGYGGQCKRPVLSSGVRV